MRSTKRLALLLCLAALPLWCHAQSSRSAIEVPVVTPLLDQSTLAFSSELERSNYVSGGVSLGTSFDDNALNTADDRSSNSAYSFSPILALDQTRSRLSWKLNYAGGFVMNQRVGSRNQTSTDLGVEGRYRLSPHVTFQLHDHFFRTTGFYDQLNENFNAPGGILQRPNQFVITPLSKQTGNTASAKLDYQCGRDSQVGMTGSFYLVHYADMPIGTTLIDSQTAGAGAYYSHRIVSNHWIGVTYRYEKLTFSQLDNRTLVHGILFTDTIYLTPQMTIALFAGPERLDVSSSLGFSNRQTQWTGAAGASYNWNGRHTSFLADGSRMVSDGGGLLGAVQLTSANAAVRRQLTQSLATQLGLMYGNNRALSADTSPFTSLKMLSAKFSVDRSLGNDLLVTLGYGRDLQQQYHGQPGSAEINHNRAWATLSYNFKRPLGR